MDDKLRILSETNHWTMVRAFFHAYTIYEPIYNNYEDRVHEHANRQGINRRYLKLPAADLAKLMSFDELEGLRNGPLYEFKEICHTLWRNKEATKRDRLERYASELFHNVSILKEHQNMVETLVPRYDETEQQEIDSVLAEVHEEFPILVHRLKGLFDKTNGRIKELFPKFAQETIFIRSLYLCGSEVFDELTIYPQGSQNIYALMYPEGKAVQGHLEVAHSFKDSGFFSRAREACEAGLKYHDKLRRRIKKGHEDPYLPYVNDIEMLLKRLPEGGPNSL